MYTKYDQEAIGALEWLQDLRRPESGAGREGAYAAPSRQYGPMLESAGRYHAGHTASEATDYMVTAQRLNVRSSASSQTSGNVIGTLTNGQRLRGTLLSSGWVRIDNGHRQGYVWSRYVSPVATAPATTASTPVESMPLTGSVGKDADNHESDVRVVQQRLNALGFRWVTVDGAVGEKTIWAIRLFQSIKGGLETVGGDGLVDVNGDTHQWLAARNAPRWLRMPASGTGFVNIEVTCQHNDDHDYGTDWMASTIIAAASSYQEAYLNSHSASLLTVNDVSRPWGGDTPDHDGHETGLSCDLRLPVTQEAIYPGVPPAGTVNSSQYDRNAARAMLRAFRAQPLFKLAYLNDSVLINEGLCSWATGHGDHIHVAIKPPARVP